MVIDKIKITKAEAEVLDSTDQNFFQQGKTDVKCPRCGREIERVQIGNSYTIKCVDDHCISLDYRGI
jgi:Zn finger protein HypA/HybF involved in hydrogenase expression